MKASSALNKNDLQLHVFGDFNDHFTPFAVCLISRTKRFHIQLNEKQVNMASFHDDPLKPIEGLVDILRDSGHPFMLNFIIENGKDKDANDFLATHDHRIVKTTGPHRDIVIMSSNPKKPDQGNIVMESESGFTFTISMEWEESPTTQEINKLKNLLSASQI